MKDFPRSSGAIAADPLVMRLQRNGCLIFCDISVKKCNFVL